MQLKAAYPPSIRARVHDSAISRVSRFFNGTLDDAFVELLQNARRAGATTIRIYTEPLANNQYTITVTDDGAGISDPSVLLSFGHSAWAGDTAAAEDPAGIGFYSLAKHGCSIASRPACTGPTAPGWRAQIVPDAFLGKTPTAILHDDSAPTPHGTAVSFVSDQNPDQVGSTLAAAARYFPLPVRLNGHSVARKSFLQNSIRTETWMGLTFGVCRNDYASYPEHDVNFHGRTFRAGLPKIECIEGGTWSVRADIRACPRFELVLPARKEPVSNDFLKEMRRAAATAIYRAIAEAETQPRLAYQDFKTAADAGIRIQQPPPSLQPWRPPVADIDHWHEMPAFEPLGPNAVLMIADPETHHGQALYRGTERAGLAQRFLAPDRRFEGYAWYDALPRVTDFSADVIHGGRVHTVVEPACDHDEPAGRVPDRTPFKFDARPDGIVLHLHVTGSDKAIPNIDIPADVLFLNEESCWVGDIDPILAADSDITTDQLAELVHAAFFSPSDDADADSYDTQKARFDEEAMRIALTLLASEDEALEHVIAEAIWREVFWVMPTDRKITITVADRKVSVAFGPAARPTREVTG